MLIINILLLLLLYIITSYIMVILYEKGASIFGTRMLLITVLILYTCLTHDSLLSWSEPELWVIGTIFLAHLFTINRYSFSHAPSKVVSKNECIDENDELENTTKSSSSNWLLSFILLTWLFHDGDDDDFF